MPQHPWSRAVRRPELAVATAAALVLGGALASLPVVERQAVDVVSLSPAAASSPVLLGQGLLDAAPPPLLPVPQPAPLPPAPEPPPVPPPPAPAPPPPPAAPVVAAAPAAPAPVAAPQPVPIPAPAPERASRSARDDRAEQALASLDYPWQELGYEIGFEPYTGRFLGMTDNDARTITVYVRRRDTVQSLRVTLAHEVGHAVDHLTGSDEQRTRYRQVRGIAPDGPWYGCDRCEDYDTPAGDYAEVFAVWLVGPTDYRSRMGPPPDQQQLEQLAPLFAPPSARQAATQP